MMTYVLAMWVMLLPTAMLQLFLYKITKNINLKTSWILIILYSTVIFMKLFMLFQLLQWSTLTWLLWIIVFIMTFYYYYRKCKLWITNHTYILVLSTLLL